MLRNEKNCWEVVHGDQIKLRYLTSRSGVSPSCRLKLGNISNYYFLFYANIDIFFKCKCRHLWLEICGCEICVAALNRSFEAALSDATSSWALRLSVFSNVWHGVVSVLPQMIAIKAINQGPHGHWLMGSDVSSYSLQDDNYAMLPWQHVDYFCLMQNLLDAAEMGYFVVKQRFLEAHKDNHHF